MYVLTGSLAKEIEVISGRICDTQYYTLQPITYLEQLSWKYHCSYEEALKHSTNEEYLNYLKSNKLNVPTTLNISKSLEDLWVECSILNKEYNFYGETGKLRYLYDVYYTANYDACVIEVKNRPKNSTHVIDYLDTLNSINQNEDLREFIISCNDTLYSETNIKPIVRMRNDVIVALLELAVINNDSRNLSVTDLYIKYSALFK